VGLTPTPISAEGPRKEYSYTFNHPKGLFLAYKKSENPPTTE